MSIKKFYLYFDLNSVSEYNISFEYCLIVIQCLIVVVFELSIEMKRNLFVKTFIYRIGVNLTDGIRVRRV